MIDSPFIELSDELTALIDLAMARLEKSPRVEDFLLWMQREGAERHGSLFHFDPDTRTKNLRAYELGRAIYECIPWIDRGMGTRRLPPLAETDACPCGSGVTFRRCCRDVPLEEGLPSLEFERSAAYFRNLRRLLRPSFRALRDDQLVPPARAVLAEVVLESGDAPRAQAMLQPLFEPTPGEAAGLTEEHAAALLVLVRCYRRQNQQRRALALVQQALSSGVPRLQALGHLSLSEMLMAEQQSAARPYREEAWSHFRLAMAADPTLPDYGPREIALLCWEGHADIARQRALSHLRRAPRGPAPDPGKRGHAPPRIPGRAAPRTLLGRFYGLAVDNPYRALVWAAALRRPDLGMLMQIIEHSERAVHKQVPPRPLEFFYSVQATPDPMNSEALEISLVPADLQHLERDWKIITPRSTEARAGEAPVLPLLPLLRRPDTERWLTYLMARPRSLESVVVLDEVSQAVLQLEEGSHAHQGPCPWIDRVLLDPLLQRAAWIYRAALAKASDREARSAAVIEPGPLLFWPDGPLNRPLTRMLCELGRLKLRGGDLRGGVALLEDLLLHHAAAEACRIRPVYIEAALRLGDRPEQVASIAGAVMRRGQERHPTVLFGWALALFQLGRLDPALRVAQEACRLWPRITAALLRSGTRRRAVLADDGIPVPAWHDTPGALPFLTEAAAQLRSAVPTATGVAG